MFIKSGVHSQREIRILIVEDVATDAEMAERELRKANISFCSKRVDTKEAFLRELTVFTPDIILSDYSLPKFNGLEALRLLKQSKLDIPLILATGSLTEEVAVRCMKEGASDYILKTSLTRLPSAVLNVLEKVEAEKAKAVAVTSLRHSEQQYRLITENTRDLICVLDLKGTFVYVSPSSREALGYAPEEMVGLRSIALVHPDDSEIVARSFLEGLSSKDSYAMELRYKHRNGEWRTFESIRNWVLDESGNTQSAVVVSRDITERKRIYEALGESERRYRQLGEGILHQVWTAQPDGNLDYVNGRTLEYFGRTSEQMLGEGWRGVVHQEDFPTCIKHWTMSLQTGDPYETEFRLLNADGTYRWHLALATAGRGSEGEIIKWFGTNTDVHDQKLAEEALRASEEQLRQSQKLEAVGQLAGGVAHDFNNLLTVITGYSDLLLRGFKQDESVRPKLEEIKKAAVRASALTRQLLAFSRKQVLQPKVLDLNSLVTDTSKMLHRLIGEDVDMTSRLDSALGQIKADYGQIEQVLMNLVVNARDAMPQGGKLTIETRNIYLDQSDAHQRIAVEPGNYVMLAVSDTGCGMDAAIQARIFEPFYTTKEAGKGTGLGLSTVYGIVKQSGGNIFVYSEPGQGTTFKIYLPRVDEAVESTGLCDEATETSQGSETILIVEDEPAVRALLLDLLEMDGYQVLEAANGAEALQICRDNEDTIHLMITDVVMPQMGGREVAQSAALIRPQMRVLFMSGYTDDAIGNHGVLDSDVAFLEKPFTPDAVACKVREVLDASPKEMECAASDVNSKDIKTLGRLMKTAYDIILNNGHSLG
jgi:PAS domain S-box-containing protein